MGFAELFTRSQLPQILNISVTRTMRDNNLLLLPEQCCWLGVPFCSQGTSPFPKEWKKRRRKRTLGRLKSQVCCPAEESQVPKSIRMIQAGTIPECPRRWFPVWTLGWWIPGDKTGWIFIFEWPFPRKSRQGAVWGCFPTLLTAPAQFSCFTIHSNKSRAFLQAVALIAILWFNLCSSL